MGGNAALAVVLWSRFCEEARGGTKNAQHVAIFTNAWECNDVYTLPVRFHFVKQSTVLMVMCVVSHNVVGIEINQDFLDLRRGAAVLLFGIEIVRQHIMAPS